MDARQWPIQTNRPILPRRVTVQTRGTPCGILRRFRPYFISSGAAMQRGSDSLLINASLLFCLVFGRGLLFDRAALFAVHGLRGCHG